MSRAPAQDAALRFAPLSNLSANANALQTAIADALRNARASLERHDLAAARGLYEGVLTMAPDNVEALHLLGVVYLRQGDAARAEPLIARSMRAGLRHAWNIANHGAALAGVGRYRDALTMLDHALQSDPHQPAVHAARGDALLGLERYDDALAAYDRSLQRAPAQGQAWSRRGAALRALGRPADALISLDRALQLDSRDPVTHVERGHALREIGQRDEALREYRLAMVIQGRRPALLLAEGIVLTDLGRAAEALAVLDEGLQHAPADEALLYASCVALDMLHARDELLRRCERLLARNRDHVAAWLGRGNALLGLDRHRDAAQAYSEALTRAPDHVDALRNRAAAWRTLGRYDEALDDYDRALALTGAHPELLFNRAVTLQQLARYDDALDSHAQAARAPADSAQHLYTRAVALQQTGDHEAALRAFVLACQRDPQHGAARRSEAYCRLLMGDFETGWQQHEARWHATDVLLHRRHADRPLWLGVEPVAGRTVLLHAEQGYGDTLQFCRYASLVQARGATVILEAPRELATLLGSLDGVDRIVTEDDPMPTFDFQTPLMSLPLAFRTTLDTIPAPHAYLRAAAPRRDAWRARVDASIPARTLKIGIAWSGNPRHNNDENRSLPFAALAPLLEVAFGRSLEASREARVETSVEASVEASLAAPVETSVEAAPGGSSAPGVRFVSLQPQVRERDRDALAASGVVRFDEQLADFADTAALIDTLDLVIAVDTSIAHLAGAVGKPVWILLPYAPDWRWLLARDDSPWYPHARLFRQARPGDWPAVIERVGAALRELLDTRAYANADANATNLLNRPK
ncbi:tetratricopeptide repeat protein [Paraburkholderia sp. D15]|uniref:tetratricopeptide repeat protein n=1 Tax=Paraburkholderia sp. D15 TaxID=2880218 RepID=UPI002478AF9E|nr:tetratricopeptide repeat protein [Paraburkholderia sp. D15]WGS48384.1 tetratricopeptide repeat protein [Paraburkholderia sp. D15]